MRISELARQAGLSLPTVKYYLREGLLHRGVPTSATQASYDDTHVQRLRLVRALLEVGGLPVVTAREVVAAMSGDAGADLDHVLGRIQDQLRPAVPADVDTAAALAVLGDLGWDVDPDSLAVRQLALAMDAAEQVGLPLTSSRLQTYADAAYRVAAHDLAHSPDEPLAMVTYAVTGTVFYEPILLALRRLAHQDRSLDRFGESADRPRAQPSS